MKTVVFVSRGLLEPPLQTLDRDDVAAGIAYMQSLARMCETGSRSVAMAAEGATLQVLRM